MNINPNTVINMFRTGQFLCSSFTGEILFETGGYGPETPKSWIPDPCALDNYGKTLLNCALRKYLNRPQSGPTEVKEV